MRCQSLLSTAALIALASALPLNINLGAYSPALVVGDGSISFEEGGKGAEALVNSLQGAAVTGAAARAEAAPAAPVEAVNGDVRQASVATPILTEAAGFPIPGSGTKAPPSNKELDPRIQVAATKTKRDLAGFDRALKYAEAALTKGPNIQLGTGAEGSGVGIIVNNHASAAGGEAAAGGRGIVVE
ncbi:hypothetical protein B0H66DRAFT_249984 [Apodospora peruviana]|uniref:Uncharacterized protein n=1 Tax=Apodospora peruviana TaxID=516989 RepID=A0AAE0I5H4_9PEZI|nr:hypothetical protein B0H66DRAFT_249984 [Apodospora peruviana]